METGVISIIKDLLDAAAIPYTEVTAGEMIGQPLFVVATTNKALTAPHGDALRAFDLLVKKIAEQRGVTEGRQFMIDINGVRARQVAEIETKAKMMAERARSFEYDVELTPMSAFERLVVHAALADTPNVTTESQGEGRERRVVIRYQAHDKEAQISV